MGLAKIGVSNLTNNLTPNVKTKQEQVVIGATALRPVANLTAGELDANTKHVWIQVKLADICATFDYNTENSVGRTTPTALSGFKYVDGTSAVLSANMFNEMQAIRTASTSVTMEVLQLTH